MVNIVIPIHAHLHRAGTPQRCVDLNNAHVLSGTAATTVTDQAIALWLAGAS